MAAHAWSSGSSRAARLCDLRGAVPNGSNREANCNHSLTRWHHPSVIHIKSPARLLRCFLSYEVRAACGLCPRSPPPGAAPCPMPPCRPGLRLVGPPSARDTDLHSQISYQSILGLNIFSLTSERERGRNIKEREPWIDRLPPASTLLGIRPTAQAGALTGIEP